MRPSRLLNRSRKFKDVHAAFGYLTYRAQERRALDVRGLAMAIEMKGKPEDVKMSLNYAADLAQPTTHNPNDLVSVADKMSQGLLRSRRVAARRGGRQDPPPLRAAGDVDQPGPEDRDPKRMAIDRPPALARLAGKRRILPPRLASRPSSWRSTPRSRSRRGSRRPDSRLPAAEARDVFIRLTWDGDADYDLVVQEPLGAIAQFAIAPHGLRRLDYQERLRQHPEEIYVCPAASTATTRSGSRRVLHRPKQADHAAHGRDDPPRGDRPREQADLRAELPTISTSRSSSTSRGASQEGAAVREPGCRHSSRDSAIEEERVKASRPATTQPESAPRSKETTPIKP